MASSSTTTETTPSSAPSPADARALLLAYLAHRSVPCPRCRFDLRDAREARCPECGESLRLQVGTAQPLLGWLIVAMAPGVFSAIAGAILAVPMTLTTLFGRGAGIPPEAWFCESVAFVSVAILVVIWRGRWRFLALRPKVRAGIAIGLWVGHAIAAVWTIFVL